jgi:hypothetical protein
MCGYLSGFAHMYMVWKALRVHLVLTTTSMGQIAKVVVVGNRLFVAWHQQLQLGEVFHHLSYNYVIM